MQVIFSDRYINTAQLYPFALTRNVEDIRVGIFTIKEKWIKGLNATTIDADTDLDRTSENGYVITANVLPNKELIDKTKMLKPGQKICDEKGRILVKHARAASTARVIEVSEVSRIEFPWDIFQENAAEILEDFELAQAGRKAMSAPGSVHFINKKRIFLEKGCQITHAIINAEEGPVFIEKGAKVMEGCLLRGPLFVGAGAVVKMGTKIYGGTSIGPGCTVGGEIKNSVLLEHSNKAHEGYLGDSVIGAWCNIGGGTSNSNLKNNAGPVTVHLQEKTYVVGRKCGMFMGDFSRIAINTAVNTGTVIGVSANVFGKGLTPRFIPSFSWGYEDEKKYELDKALKDAAEWKSLKGADLTAPEVKMLKNIYHSKIKMKIK